MLTGSFHPSGWCVISFVDVRVAWKGGELEWRAIGFDPLKLRLCLVNVTYIGVYTDITLNTSLKKTSVQQDKNIFNLLLFLKISRYQ